jgi:predicted PurR-regulated permease PerM
VQPQARGGLVRTLLAVLFVGGLVGASLWILYPFLSALIWAALLVVSTWSLMRRLERRLWGQRKLAALVMTATVLVLVIVPVSLIVSTLSRDAGEFVARAATPQGLAVPAPPAWARELPYIGERLTRGWRELAALEPDALRERFAPYAEGVTRWLLHQAGSLALFFLHLALTVIIAAVLYLKGEHLALGVRAFARRLAGARGEEMVFLSAQAIRAVALGVIVTAGVEAALGAIGLVAAGVPFPALLTALLFFCAVAQAPALVLLPVAGWLYWKGGSPVAASVFLVWSLAIIVLDNILRPILIKRSANLPLSLVFAGAAGGLIAFGAMGLFIGPVVLAVAYTLLVGWIDEGQEVEIIER